MRDRVLQFSDAPLREAADLIPEMQEVLPLLERARHGIEFFGMSELTDGAAGAHQGTATGCADSPSSST